MQKEVLTKSLIEQEIKKLYIWYIKYYLLASVFVFIGFIVLWNMCDLKHTFMHNIILTILSVMYISVLLLTFTRLILYIYNYFKKDLKLVIITDTLVKFDRSRVFLSISLWRILKCLCFAKNGKFTLEWDRPYYPLSTYYNKIDESKIADTSYPGDEFYLVIKNKKILNVYNTKFFELKNDT